MIKNFSELKELLSHFPDNQHFIYLDKIHFEIDDISRNGIFLENENRTELISIFLYAKDNQLVSTGSAFMLFTYGKNFLDKLLSLVSVQCDKFFEIKERFEKACEGEWKHSKDAFVVSKATNSYTIWAVNNELKFKSENLNFILNLVPDLKFLIQKVQKEGKFALI